MKMRLKAKFFALLSLAAISFCFTFMFNKELNENFNYPYKIFSHKNDINQNRKDGYDFFLNCKNELGIFSIDVTRETYYNNHDGDVIKFDGGFDVYELYQYAINESTKKNVLSLIKDDDIKYYVKHELLGLDVLFCVAFSIIFFISIMSDKGQFDDD